MKGADARRRLRRSSMNDDRPIEKLLHRYAKKRRDAAGAPLELHPATRRLLQGEVSRQFSKAGAEGNRAVVGWFAAFRPRWVYAAAALGVVLIAGVMLVMNSNQSPLATEPPKFELAKNEISPAKVADKEVLPHEGEADAATGITASTPMSAPAREPSPSQPTRAALSAWKNDKPPRASAPALAFTGDADRQRALNETPAPISASSLSRDAEPFALAQNEIAKKASQAITPVEAYTSAAMTNQSVSALPGANPVILAPTATFADERTPLAIAAQDQAGSLADSSARVDSKVAANPPQNLPAPAAPVAFETQTGVAPPARYGLSTRAKTAAVSQSFANRAPIPVMKKLPKDAPTSPVLANFQMEQAGDQLRVIDGDGSIYLGDLNLASARYGGGSKGAAAVEQEEKLAVRRSVAAAAAAQPSAQNYLYRVAGTNRTLNQRVEFTWNFVALTNAPAQSKTQVVGDKLKQASAEVPQQFPALLQNSSIQGRAQINVAKEIEINAVPVKP